MNHRPILTRRQFLQQSASGFGSVALAGLMSDKAYGALPAAKGGVLAARHHKATARNVIFLYMDGGPSQVDTFDPKPLLTKENGNPIRMANLPATQFDNIGAVLKSPWDFHQYGESGIPVSDLFPHVASCVDDLAVVRSMTSAFPEHTFANYFLHTGLGLQGRPSMGAWMSYGLGSESRDLPGFVVLNGGMIPPGGLENFGSGFLPASAQGSVFAPQGTAVANVAPQEASSALQQRKLGLLEQLDASVLERNEGAGPIESAIENYELAFRMQAAVPDLMDLSDETEATKKLYGLDSDFVHTQTYGRQCLLARRLVERGVRFIELTCPNTGGDRWDQHQNLQRDHANNARMADQPIAGLLKDLRSRGLLDSTLVVWAGEFGRTPMAQGTNGRDHNPKGFTIWLAGGGIKGGTIYGATDEWGYFAVENKVEVHDLHATMMHLMGIDHERLTFRFSARDMRLTDVHGHVIHDIIA
ncbi:MAG: hypothetical protein ACI841_001562 [Planctomycetota bacterium]|jgi:hypothetical protein